MKRVFLFLTLLLFVASPALSLSNADYSKFKKNANFYRADKRLNQVWKDLQKELGPDAMSGLKKQQTEWVSSGRDKAARGYIKKGYSRVEAYTMATNDRADYLSNVADSLAVEDYDDDDGKDKGEIEEKRFEGTPSSDPEGNYSRKSTGKRGGFMTVLITDRSEMEATVTISVLNPEATWTAQGWIDDNVLEVSDKDYNECQATLKFSDGEVLVETSDSDDWDEILGSGIRLDGTYVKNAY